METISQFLKNRIPHFQQNILKKDELVAGMIWALPSSLYCKMSPLVSMFITFSNLGAVMPITLDRAVAVFTPLK